MTLQEAYQYGQKQLKNANIEDADVDAWHLLEFVTGLTRTQYFMRLQEPLASTREERYRECIAQRCNHIPLQHITGVQEFMGLEFCVNENVLIPRQDTEVLVESVLKVMQPGMHVLDMCTGSGCIAISLAKHSACEEVMGVDISESALKTAMVNAKKQDVRVKFVQSDLFSQVEGKFDVIVSNPPYIRTMVIGELEEEVKLHDPILALDGKEDGLFFYRKIIEAAPQYLKQNGQLYFEIGHDQGQDVKKLMEAAGFADVTIKKDLAGLDRVVFGVYI